MCAQVWPLLLGCITATDTYSVQQRKAGEIQAEYSHLRQVAGLKNEADKLLAASGASEDWQTVVRHIEADSTRTGQDAPLFQGEQRAQSVWRLRQILEVGGGAVERAHCNPGYCTL